MLRILREIFGFQLWLLGVVFKDEDALYIQLYAMRQQLAIYHRTRPRPRLTDPERAFWVVLRERWPAWREALIIVKPETVVSWHRKAYRFYWRRISSTKNPGRPRIPVEVRELIRKLATENPWSPLRVLKELHKLDILVGLSTVKRYFPRRPSTPGQRQSWRTFLSNLVECLAGMDFFVVPTATFRILYVFFIIEHGRRRIRHVNVTANPTEQWVLQQLREAFPGDEDHPIRYVIHDNDAIFSKRVRDALPEWFQIESKATGLRAPWQNPYAERWIGIVRRELLDHVIVFNEEHLRRRLRDFVDYYHQDRGHLGLDLDTPEHRPVESRASPHDDVIGLPRVGGLHHRYTWRQAA